jgi:hypothetical protein
MEICLCVHSDKRSDILTLRHLACQRQRPGRPVGAICGACRCCPSHTAEQGWLVKFMSLPGLEDLHCVTHMFSVWNVQSGCDRLSASKCSTGL